jgi:hypothetical protein
MTEIGTTGTSQLHNIIAAAAALKPYINHGPYLELSVIIRISEARPRTRLSIRAHKRAL